MRLRADLWVAPQAHTARALGLSAAPIRPSHFNSECGMRNCLLIRNS